jgi:hypothetical protein
MTTYRLFVSRTAAGVEAEAYFPGTNAFFAKRKLNTYTVSIITAWCWME